MRVVVQSKCTGRTAELVKSVNMNAQSRVGRLTNENKEKKPPRSELVQEIRDKKPTTNKLLRATSAAFTEGARFSRRVEAVSGYNKPPPDFP